MGKMKKHQHLRLLLDFIGKWQLPTDVIEKNIDNAKDRNFMDICWIIQEIVILKKTNCINCWISFIRPICVEFDNEDGKETKKLKSQSLQKKKKTNCLAFKFALLPLVCSAATETCNKINPSPGLSEANQVSILVIRRQSTYKTDAW